MKRRDFLVQTTVVATASLVPFKKLFASHNTVGTFSDIRRNVGYFTGAGGTIGWLVSDDALVVIDSQYPQSGRECLDGLSSNTTHSLDVLINTHHHGDHTMGNIVFQKPAKHIVSHENVPKFMKQAYGGGDRELAYPDLTFTESWKEDFGSETVYAKYYGPAHTNGDAVIYFEKANVVHVGDLVFNRLNPLTDPDAGASIHNWINVLNAIVEDYPADAIYIFGHGNPEFGITGSKSDVTVMSGYLTGLIEYVRKGIKEGKSKKEIIDRQEMVGFPDFIYGSFFTLSQNLEIVYNEITDRKNG